MPTAKPTPPHGALGELRETDDLAVESPAAVADESVESEAVGTQDELPESRRPSSTEDGK